MAVCLISMVFCTERTGWPIYISSIVSAMGYKTVKQRVNVEKGVAATVNLVIPEEALMLEELTVTASSVEREKKTPFNAVAVDAKEWANSTKNLSDAL